MNGETAERREVELGLRDEDLVEVTRGLSAGELLIVLGQDGLADGTPVSVLEDTPQTAPSSTRAEEPAGPPPEAIAAMRQRMKERGLSDEEIEQRIQQARSGEGRGRGQGGGQGGSQRGGMGRGAGGGEIPPFMVQRIKEASPDELEQIKGRMQQFGISQERIEEIVKKIRGEGGAAQ